MSSARHEPHARTTPSTPSTSTTTTTTTALPRAFTILLGITTLGILLQAVTAGLFVNQGDSDAWVTVHGVIADVTWISALATAVVAFKQLRHRHRTLFIGAAVLFVATLAQTGLGHLISDQGMDGLIMVHVPLAVLIFGLAIWLSAASARRALPAAATPYADDPVVRRRTPAGVHE